MAGKEQILVIVESPTKARTITKFLGKGFIIKASNGHVRDLPNSASEIPQKFKKEPWARLAVNVDANFEPLYVIPKNKKDNLKALKEAMKSASALYLATDEDREGESISWHLVEALKPKIPIKRLVFHEITKDAIQQAIESPRDIDENLVKAQETRRIVDRLFGYEVSPLLWKKMAPKLSAGRVQSVAVRLLVERERERQRFVKASYWALKGSFLKLKDSQQLIEADLSHLGELRVASSKDFDGETGKVPDSKKSKIVVLDEDAAKKLRSDLSQATPVVEKVEEKPYTNKPAAPFVTSSLQQEANRKLRFSAKHTMSVAQQLYENGFITYMRTDSTTLSAQAIEAARGLIKREFGDNFLPDAPRVYKTKVKNAQEAHEAIRPAGEEFTAPLDVKNKLGEDALKLYELIWKRTIACQMKNATGKHIVVQIRAGEALFRTTGKTIEFPGFLRAYVEGSDDPEADLADKERLLPQLTEGEELKAKDYETSEHITQPPPRYTEGSIIKELEKRGIGRPSTWAAIVDVVLGRGYAFKRGTTIIPTFIAFGVVRLLENHFQHLLDYEFTARLEDDLDAISRGEAVNLNYLKQFYFGNGHPGLKDLISQGEEKIDPREVCGLPIGKKDDGTLVEVRIGRYGLYVTDGETTAGLADNLPPDEMTLNAAVEMLEKSAQGPTPLGVHPESQLPIFLKEGPYGPYLQEGEPEDGKKPKMTSLLPGKDPAEVDLEYAVALLSLPKDLGEHPEMNNPILLYNGRYGPYIKCGSETRSIPLDEYPPLEMTLEQAIALLAQPKRGRRAAKPTVLKELGAHPKSEATVNVLKGRYGPYVTDGEINASLPKGTEPEDVTIELAVELLAARAAKGNIKKKRKTKAKATSKAKKATTKTKKAKTSAEKKTKTKAKTKKTKPSSKPKASEASQ